MPRPRRWPVLVQLQEQVLTSKYLRLRHAASEDSASRRFRNLNGA